jgi:hypothetical protein
VQLEKKQAVGAFENQLLVKSEFFYKAESMVQGFGMRKLKLKPLSDKFPELRD